MPLLTEARILRYCTRGVLRTTGDMDGRTLQTAQVFRVPMHLDLVSLSFIGIENRSLSAYCGQLHYPCLAKRCWVKFGVTAGLSRQQFVMHIGPACCL